MRKMLLLLIGLCLMSFAASAEGEDALTPWNENTRIDEVTSWEGFGGWGG